MARVAPEKRAKLLRRALCVAVEMVEKHEFHAGVLEAEVKLASF